MDDLSMKGGVIRSSNQNIVHVDKDHVRVLQFEGSEDAIHYALEGCWGIALTKQHNHGLKESQRHFKRSLPLVPIPDVDVVVPPSDVKLSEEAFPSKVLCERGDIWEGIDVLDRPRI